MSGHQQPYDRATASAAELREAANRAFLDKRLQEQLQIEQLRAAGKAASSASGADAGLARQAVDLASSLLGAASAPPARGPTHSAATTLLQFPGDLVTGATRVKPLSAAPALSEAERRQREHEAHAAAFAEIQRKRAALPVSLAKDALLQFVRTHQVFVLVGETGSGKTTQVPQFLLEAGYGKVVCTQPRVLAATSVAERVAAEAGVRLGSRVGYSVRFDNKSSESTELLFATDGIMLKEFASDPMLSKYNAVMIDEAHERSVNTDILLGLLKDLIRRRKDLRVVVASATLESGRFSDFFGGAPTFTVPGRTFPISTCFTSTTPDDYVAAAATVVFDLHLEKAVAAVGGPGADILVFLPGQDDIERCETLLQERMQAAAATAVRELIILPLYSAMPMDKQRRIYDPAPPGTRKVILATNIAETSITVDGITYVVDSGLCKQKHFDSNIGADALVVVPVSRAAANQRKGRAGRTQPGVCIRLYPKSEFLKMDGEPVAEILRSSLCSVVLGLKSLGINDPIHFDFLEAPSQPALLRALTELFVLGALSSSSAELTTLGRQMAELPLEPPMSKMLIVSHIEHKCAVQAAAAVAILSLQNSAFAIPRGKRDDAEATTQRFFLGSFGDACGYARIFADWEAQGRGTHWTKAHFLNPSAMQRAFDVRNQIVGALSRLFAEPLTSDTNPATADVGVARSFVAGFFQNAARLAVDTVSYNVIKSRAEGVFVHPSSCFASYVAPTPAQRQRRAEERAKRGVGLDESHAAFQNCNHITGKPELVVFSELRQTSRAFMSHVIAVTPDWLMAAAPLHFFRSDDLGSAPAAPPAASAPLRRLREPDTAAGRAGAQLIDEMNF